MPSSSKWLLAMSVLALPQSVRAQTAQDSVAAALTAGTVKLNLRLRYEDVDQDGATDAQALTQRTRLTYTSGSYRGIGLTLEMDDVTEWRDQDYSDGVTDRGTAVIADPESTEVNQAYLSYATTGFTGKYGRQRILLNNQRFVGGVGWRQDEQTYDGPSLLYSGTENLTAFYAYVTQVNRIFAEALDADSKIHLANISYKTPAGTITGYNYLLDEWGLGDAAETNTLGLRWEGMAAGPLTYNLEFARQSDAGDNPGSFDRDYWLAEIATTIPIAADVAFNFGLSYEVLGSDNGAGFTTPLATLHAFQGWADKFLSTPAGGIEDLYLTVGAKVSGFNTQIVYHEFSADTVIAGIEDYGSEVDFLVGRTFGPVALLFKLANYSADQFATDTTKYWLQAEMTF